MNSAYRNGSQEEVYNGVYYICVSWLDGGYCFLSISPIHQCLLMIAEETGFQHALWCGHMSKVQKRNHPYKAKFTNPCPAILLSCILHMPWPPLETVSLLVFVLTFGCLVGAWLITNSWSGRPGFLQVAK